MVNKYLLISLFLTLFLTLPIALADITLNCYVLPPTEKVFITQLIPTVMGAGAVLWLVGMFIGSPRNPEELINFSIASVLVFFLITAGISIVVGLI